MRNENVDRWRNTVKTKNLPWHIYWGKKMRKMTASTIIIIIIFTPDVLFWYWKKRKKEK